MVYINELKLPSVIEEHKALYGDREKQRITELMRKAHLNGVNLSMYPFNVFTKYTTRLRMGFSSITILYGGNGSGKSTLLNIIAEKLKLFRNSPFNSSMFFEDYCDLCEIETGKTPLLSKIITSDDIFAKMQTTRKFNLIIDDDHQSAWDDKNKKLFEIAVDPTVLRLKGIEDFQRFKAYYDAIKHSTSEFIVERTKKSIESRSNGETALDYISGEFSDNSLLLLDEPENSLSPVFQIELKKIIEDYARFFGCQFIVATHSPILLSMENATVFDLDDECKKAKWYELENVKIMASLFFENKDKFLPLQT